jgi:hypothetical protein
MPPPGKPSPISRAYSQTLLTSLSKDKRADAILYDDYSMGSSRIMRTLRQFVAAI